jgi:hypothetical protein
LVWRLSLADLAKNPEQQDKAKSRQGGTEGCKTDMLTFSSFLSNGSKDIRCRGIGWLSLVADVC